MSSFGDCEPLRELFFPTCAGAVDGIGYSLPLGNVPFVMLLVNVRLKMDRFWFFEDSVPVGQIRLEKLFHPCAGATVRLAKSYHLFAAVPLRPGGLTAIGVLLSSRFLFDRLLCWKVSEMTSAGGVLLGYFFHLPTTSLRRCWRKKDQKWSSFAFFGIRCGLAPKLRATATGRSVQRGTR